MTWVSRKEAASALGINERSVDRRVYRGSMERRKAADGSWEYLLDSAEAKTPVRAPEPASDADERYWSEVDAERRIVIAYIPWLKKPLRVSFEQDAQLFRAYSSDGEGMTQKEMAQHLGWDVKRLRAYLRARGLQHASDPWPEHEMAESTDEELLASAESIRAAKLRREFDKREVAALRREASIGRAVEQWLKEASEAYSPSVRVAVRCVPATREQERIHWIVPETDSHLDAMGSEGEGFEEQVAALRQERERLIARCLRLGEPASWTWWCGSDWGNVDNKAGTTTRGTPQIQSLPPSAIVPGLTAAAYEACETYLAAGGTLNVVEVPGNHDWMFTQWLFECVFQRFRTSEAAEFHKSVGGRNYLRIGNALVICAHGDVRRLTEPTLREMAFREAPSLLYGARAIHVVRGDKHTRKQGDSAGGSGQDVSLAAMSPQSSWAEEQGYVHRPRLHALGITESGEMVYDIVSSR